MGNRFTNWFCNLGSTAKALAALVAIIMLTVSTTLTVAQQLGLPARVRAAEVAVDSLRVRAEANYRGIQAVREDTQAILCIITLPPTISPAEARLRCP
jgi:phage/plasmid primase-like uncharacterized protein